MLALLEGVVKQREVAEEALRPHAECLVREMVLPNAVWRAGLVAATVRKVTKAWCGVCDWLMGYGMVSGMSAVYGIKYRWLRCGKVRDVYQVLALRYYY